MLFTTFGSFGDVHPYLAIGNELRQRGHQVTIATSAAYRAKVEAENLGFHPVRPDMEGFEEPALAAQLFDRKRGSERVIRLICSFVRESYQDTLAPARQTDLIVTHMITFAAVAIAQKFQMPWVSSILAPFSMLSAVDPPLFPQSPLGFHFRAFGPRVLRGLYKLGDRQSRSWMRPLFALRRELGLSTKENPLFGGSRSPELDLALFSSQLAAPQPDWPAQSVVTGFPFFDRDYQQAALLPKLEQFLESGPAPVIFTLGSSAVYAAKDFYRASLTAVERIGARAIFLTGSHPQDLPHPLPSGSLALAYAPHSAIFSRASVIVHQGGIGTTAQAMRSGRPMLVVPFSHDQFDNGDRVRRLGAGEMLPRSRYTAKRAESLIRQLLISPAYQRTACSIGEAVRSENGAACAAEAIVQVLERKRS